MSSLFNSFIARAYSTVPIISYRSGEHFIEVLATGALVWAFTKSVIHD